MHSPLKTIKLLGEVDVSYYVNLFSDIEDEDWMGEFAKFSKRNIRFFSELERLPLLHATKGFIQEIDNVRPKPTDTIEDVARRWNASHIKTYRKSNADESDVILKGKLFEKYYDNKFFDKVFDILTEKIGVGECTMLIFNLLNPYSEIKPHYDRRTGNNKRIHIPIITHPDITLCNGDDEIHMEKGKIYLIDHSINHSVNNPTDCERIHLVMDWRPNE